MITCYLDMDQVICDFHKYYGEVNFNPTKFKNHVMCDKIFENLEWTPNGLEFVNRMIGILETSRYKYNIQLLSSLGAPGDRELQLEAARQKKVWLNTNGFDGFHANFCVHKGLKKRHATPNSILIDDTPQNIFDWNEHHGHGLLYNDIYLEDNLEKFKTILNKIQYKMDTNIIDI